MGSAFVGSAHDDEEKKQCEHDLRHKAGKKRILPRRMCAIPVRGKSAAQVESCFAAGDELRARLWAFASANLPLLAQERYFTKLKRGYARGWEPVGFVRNVQTYAELLRWMIADEPDSTLADEKAPQ